MAARTFLQMLRRAIGDESGQAMVEYSAVSWVLLVGAAGLAWPFLRSMINAFDRYYDSLYFVLTLPFP